MSAITKQADACFGSIELSLTRRESALCNTKSLALCAGQREGNGTQPDSDAIRFDVSDGSWPCKNTIPREVGEKPGPVRSQAAIAVISGLIPTMFMTRVRL